METTFVDEAETLPLLHLLPIVSPFNLEQKNSMKKPSSYFLMIYFYIFILYFYFIIINPKDKVYKGKPTKDNPQKSIN